MYQITRRITDRFRGILMALEIRLDVLEQQMFERLVSLSTLYQELINDLISGYISVSSHRLNQIMKVLTLVTVMFLPLGLIVGLYGMNFENMPEPHFEYGYFVVLGLMATVVITLLVIFRRMRWI